MSRSGPPPSPAGRFLVMLSAKMRCNPCEEPLLMNSEVKMSEDFKDAVPREQIRLVMEQVPTMQAVSFMVALVLVYEVRDIVAPASILVWVLMVLLIVCSRVVLHFRFCKVREEPFDAEYWKNLYLASALISGVVLALLLLLFSRLGISRPHMPFFFS